jgi:uncharacterized membrane protein HdeD (DUF308 family)
MKGSTLFWATIILAVICALIGVYYLIPGVYHVLSFKCGSNVRCAETTQTKHVILFFALAVVLLIASRFTRTRPAVSNR